MYERIVVSNLWADVDGAVLRQANGYFDLSQAPENENRRRLEILKATRHIANVAPRWEYVSWQAVITDTQVIPPQYFGDFILFYWSRGFTKPEDRAAVEAESLKALSEAVEAMVAAGFGILDHVNRCESDREFYDLQETGRICFAPARRKRARAMNVTELTDQELAELYQPWAIEFIRKHGREPAAIDSLRHHGDYMMAKGGEADEGDLQILSRLFNPALEELAEETPATSFVGSCPRTRLIKCEALDSPPQ